MSNQDYVHIGVYVECVNPDKIESVNDKGCTNARCRNYRQALHSQFCPACGGAVRDYKIDIAYPTVNVWDLSEAIHEALSCVIDTNTPDVSSDIWIPNHGGGVDVDMDSVTALELTPHMRTLHLDTFEATYAVAIAVLIAAYGADNVTVKWGVVKYTR